MSFSLGKNFFRLKGKFLWFWLQLLFLLSLSHIYCVSENPSPLSFRKYQNRKKIMYRRGEQNQDKCIISWAHITKIQHKFDGVHYDYCILYLRCKKSFSFSFFFTFFLFISFLCHFVEVIQYFFSFSFIRRGWFSYLPCLVPPHIFSI